MLRRQRLVINQVIRLKVTQGLEGPGELKVDVSVGSPWGSHEKQLHISVGSS